YGAYNLSGSATLHTSYLYVDPSGTFKQSGGVHAATSIVQDGVYNLSGGVLSASSIANGFAYANAVAGATFTQAGGTLNSSLLNYATFILSGGSATTTSVSQLFNGSSSVIQANAGNVIRLSGDFRSSSTQSATWDTHLATLYFVAGGSSTT